MSAAGPDLEIEAVGAAAAARQARLQAAAFPDAWGAPFFASILHLPGTVAFLARADGADAGFVLARSLAGDAEIISIAVAQPSRGRGIGAALLARALGRAAELGASSIHLEVSAGNAGARALYARAGFSRAGVRRGYYADGSDAEVLARPLSPEDGWRAG